MTYMAPTAIEAGTNKMASLETAALAVYQPQKLESLLGTIDLIDKISERVGEDRSGDWSSAGSGSQQGDDGQAAAQTARQQLIAAMPEPEIMQQKLSKNIRKEVRKMERKVKRMGHVTRRGGAYKMAVMWAKIRSLRALLEDLATAAIDVLKRLYIRVFIDKQPIA